VRRRHDLGGASCAEGGGRALCVRVQLPRGLVLPVVAADVRLLPWQGESRSCRASEVRAGSSLSGFGSVGLVDGVGVVGRFPSTGVALRPGFIYGWRRTKKGQGIPLQLVGAPISMLARDLGGFSSALSYLPFVGEEMRAAVPVGAVAKAAVLSAIGPVQGQTLDTSSMLELAASFHVHE
jgi:hypothetical protein